MSNDLFHYIDEINNREEKRNPTHIVKPSHDSNIISRILRGSKFTYHKMIDIMRCFLIAETILYYRSREQSTTYLELFGVCIAMIITCMITFSIQNYTHTNYMEYEWFHAQNSIQMDVKIKLFNRLSALHYLGMIIYICGVLPVAYFFFHRPYIVYGILLLDCLVGLYVAFENDRTFGVLQLAEDSLLVKLLIYMI